MFPGCYREQTVSIQGSRFIKHPTTLQKRRKSKMKTAPKKTDYSFLNVHSKHNHGDNKETEKIIEVKNLNNSEISENSSKIKFKLKKINDFEKIKRRYEKLSYLMAIDRIKIKIDELSQAIIEAKLSNEKVENITQNIETPTLQVSIEQKIFQGISLLIVIFIYTLILAFGWHQLFGKFKFTSYRSIHNYNNKNVNFFSSIFSLFKKK